LPLWRRYHSRCDWGPCRRAIIGGATRSYGYYDGGYGYGAYGGGQYNAAGGDCRLRCERFLGRLWLARPPRAGLLLTFVSWTVVQITWAPTVVLHCKMTVGSRSGLSTKFPTNWPSVI